MTSPELLILDVDGTLRWTTVPGQHCPWRPGEWRLMPRVAEVLRPLVLAAGGPRLGVASNQDDVAGGRLSAAMARRLIEDTLVAALGVLPPDARIEMCVHPISAGCACRKPAPGMLTRLLEATHVPPSRALFVGDLDSDREAAQRAGLAFVDAARFFGWPATCASPSAPGGTS